MKLLAATLATTFLLGGGSISLAAGPAAIKATGSAAGLVQLAQYKVPESGVVPSGATGGRSGGPNQSSYVKKKSHKKHAH